MYLCGEILSLFGCFGSWEALGQREGALRGSFFFVAMASQQTGRGVRVDLFRVLEGIVDTNVRMIV